MSNATPPRWKDLLTEANAAPSLVLAGGVGLHALNIFIVTTILPSVVADIGGLTYYACNTTLFVIASIIGSASSAQILARLAPQGTYQQAIVLFALGTLVCASASSMPVLLAGRSLQGLGGGMLVALSYAMIRLLFVPALWPRAISLVSGMWGAAALTGPFAGGVFAEFGAWRMAFWALLPLVAGFAVLSGRILRQVEPQSTIGGRLPVFRLVLLALAVLSVSVGSLTGRIGLNAAGLVAAAGLMALLARLDDASSNRLLPQAMFQPRTPLGATYTTMALLVAGTTTIIFVPFMLQTLHKLSPLAAGYLTVIEALGWTGAALVTSTMSGRAARSAIRFGPLVMLAGLLGLALLLPKSDGSLPTISFCLAMVGAGIGMGWGHLANHAIAVASEHERDLAAASISTIQLLSTAFGSALAGMVVNLVGLSDASPRGDAAQAAWWLFSLFMAAPVLAGIAASTVLARSVEQPDGS